MSRCQSTPGLVESQGRVPLEEMWVAPIDLKSAQIYSTPHSLFSPSPSPITSRAVTSVGAIADGNNVPRGAESPISATSSGPSSEDQTARVPPSAATQPSTGRQSTHSGKPHSLVVSLHSCHSSPFASLPKAIMITRWEYRVQHVISRGNVLSSVLMPDWPESSVSRVPTR